MSVELNSVLVLAGRFTKSGPPTLKKIGRCYSIYRLDFKKQKQLMHSLY